jgi:pyruvate carboxylase
MTSVERVFNKVLVANRGEIAIRAFRAAYKLGAQTVAIFPFEDRGSVHRHKADEAYQISERGHPLQARYGAYLDPQLIVITAVAAGPDAVYPGYGFLSENPELAETCIAAGVTFVSPSAEVLTTAGWNNEAVRVRKKLTVSRD